VTIEVDDLVRQAQAGETAAFGELYELLAPKLYSYLAYQLHGRTDAAEDLTAEAFLKAFQNIASFQFRDVPFTSWLYRIARNCLIDQARAEKKRGAVVDLEQVPHLLIEHDTFSGRLDRHVLTAALTELTDKQRTVVLLRTVEGFSIAETAAAMGLTQDGVKQLHSRGLRALRQILERGTTKPVGRGHHPKPARSAASTEVRPHRQLATCPG
jgi:RNA polymerase sigma-70 factor, ECF subfamily